MLLKTERKVCSGVPGGMAASEDHVGREMVRTEEQVESLREGGVKEASGLRLALAVSAEWCFPAGRTCRNTPTLHSGAGLCLITVECPLLGPWHKHFDGQCSKEAATLSA